MSINNEAIKAFWKKGVLAYKLRPEQVPIYQGMWQAIKDKESSYTVLCSRQLGKSFIDLIVAFEYCIRNPNTRVPFAIPVANNYEEMYVGSINTIIADCPKDCLPEHNTTKKTISFKNGSHIKISGVEGENYISLRGAPAGLVIVDESAFMSKLRNVIDDVLFPMTTTTGGCIIQTTTPPRTLDHDFVHYYSRDKMENRLSSFTVFESGLPKELIDRIVNKYKTPNHPTGVTNPVFRREYNCEFVADDASLIIPEWLDAKELCKVTPPLPHYYNFYHRYAAMDLGFSQDFTVCLFGYYNFEEAKLVIQREFKDYGYKYTTQKLSETLKEIEKELWGEDVTPYLRIADCNNLQMLQDMTATYKYAWNPVRKTKTPDSGLTDTKQGVLNGMVNKVRVMVSQGNIIVDPSCEQLLGCLEYATWDENVFAKSPTYGHFDALAALIYLVKVLDIYTNPIPGNLGIDPRTMHVPAKYNNKKYSDAARQLQNAFHGKKNGRYTK